MPCHRVCQRARHSHRAVSSSSSSSAARPWLGSDSGAGGDCVLALVHELAHKWQKYLSDRDHGQRHENILRLLTTPDARQNFLGYMHPWTTAFLTVKPDRSTELGKADFIEWLAARVGLTPLPRGADSRLCKSTQMLITPSSSAQHASCCNDQQALATTRHTTLAKAWNDGLRHLLGPANVVVEGAKTEQGPTCVS